MTQSDFGLPIGETNPFQISGLNSQLTGGDSFYNTENNGIITLNLVENLPAIINSTSMHSPSSSISTLNNDGKRPGELDILQNKKSVKKRKSNPPTTLKTVPNKKSVKNCKNSKSSTPSLNIDDSLKMCFERVKSAQISCMDKLYINFFLFSEQY